jgi:hypothetical protein
MKYYLASLGSSAEPRGGLFEHCRETAQGELILGGASSRADFFEPTVIASKGRRKSRSATTCRLVEPARVRAETRTLLLKTGRSGIRNSATTVDDVPCRCRAVDN